MTSVVSLSERGGAEGVAVPKGGSEGSNGEDRRTTEA